MGVNTGLPLLVKEKFDTRRKEPCDDTPAPAEPEPATGGVITGGEVVNEQGDELPDEVIIDHVKIAEIMGEPDNTNSVEFNTMDSKSLEKFLESDDYKKLIQDTIYPQQPAPVTQSEIYKDYTWFGRKKNLQILTIYNDGRFVVPAKVRESHNKSPILIGLHKSGNSVMILPDDDGVTLNSKNKKYRDLGLSKAVEKLGVTFPAKYEMSWNAAEQVWAGELMQ
jgi:hypothetical protein